MVNQGLGWIISRFKHLPDNTSLLSGSSDYTDQTLSQLICGADAQPWSRLTWRTFCGLNGSCSQDCATSELRQRMAVLVMNIGSRIALWNFGRLTNMESLIRTRLNGASLMARKSSFISLCRPPWQNGWIRTFIPLLPPKNYPTDGACRRNCIPVFI